MTLPAAPFAPVALLFMSVVESDLLAFLKEAHEVVVRNRRIESDEPEAACILDALIDAPIVGTRFVRVPKAPKRPERLAKPKGVYRSHSRRA